MHFSLLMGKDGDVAEKAVLDRGNRKGDAAELRLLLKSKIIPTHMAKRRLISSVGTGNLLRYREVISVVFCT